VIEAITDELDSNKVDSIFHIGDISYATGFLVEWDFFLQQISLVASRVSYMTAIGDHERYLSHLHTLISIVTVIVDKSKFPSNHLWNLNYIHSQVYFLG
jgi:hypothetical protein